MSRKLSQLAIPMGIVLIICMLVVPLPPMFLDVLIAFNIAAALLVLMVAMFTKRTLEFAAFPAILLVLTLFRLALNVSATRLVLLDAHAGKVIDTFGHFVVGGSLIVGLIVFSILLIIQFVVITNGAGRVAEVGARFALDAMPGKQMAIDADLNAGLIDEETARKRRADVAAEADFYGSMDGATKFVKGDAIAAVIITLVNLIGGFAVGVAQKGMPMSEAIETYSLLSIGDGLVSQIPALLLSTATGLVVTRAVSGKDMGSDITTQLLRRKTPLQVAGFASLALCIIPGMPKLPFLLVGGLALVASTRATDADPEDEAEANANGALDEDMPVKVPDTPEELLAEIQVNPLGLELAVDLIDLVDVSAGGDLLDRVKALRRKVANDMGIVVPPVRTRDNLELPLRTYAIKLFGVEVARGTAPSGTVLAISDNLDSLPGEPTTEPVFGLAAKWIPAELAARAELEGATVVDRASVITTHLAEVVRQNSSRLLSREDVKMLTDIVARTHPVVVAELTPAMLSLGEIQQVLASLLVEGVSVRDLVRIFEALSLRAKDTKDLDALTTAARLGLGGAVVLPYEADGTVNVVTFDPVLEQQLLESLRPTEDGPLPVLTADIAQDLMVSLSQIVAAAENAGITPVLACAPQLRPAVRRLIEPAFGRLAVLSYAELKAAQSISSIGVVSVGASAPVGV
jgi:flagellar biosynthesis protein FlhA